MKPNVLMTWERQSFLWKTNFLSSLIGWNCDCTAERKTPNRSRYRGTSTVETSFCVTERRVARLRWRKWQQMGSTANAITDMMKVKLWTGKEYKLKGQQINLRWHVDFLKIPFWRLQTISIHTLTILFVSSLLMNLLWMPSHPISLNICIEFKGKLFANFLFMISLTYIYIKNDGFLSYGLLTLTAVSNPEDFNRSHHQEHQWLLAVLPDFMRETSNWGHENKPKTSDSLSEKKSLNTMTTIGTYWGT